MKKCIECGRQYERNAGRKNPYWCPACDEKRIERIEKQLQAIHDELVAEREELERANCCVGG